MRVGPSRFTAEQIELQITSAEHTQVIFEGTGRNAGVEGIGVIASL